MTFSNYPRYNEFLNKNILSIDYGTKVTGLAYFTPGKEPYPIMHEKIVYKNDEKLLFDIKYFAEEDFIDILVIGIPYLLDGKETAMTHKIKDFGIRLQELCTDQRLYYQDETLSTQTAKDRMVSSPEFNFKVDLKKIDQLAAVIILEDFIKN